MTTNLFADLDMARRLEAAEAAGNSGFVESRARLNPGGGATWIDVSGTRAMFDGPESPMTQTFGLGLLGQAGPAELDRIEEFFQRRGAATFHEVCPLAEMSVMSLLCERGYRPIEMSNVLYRPIGAGTAVRESREVNVREAGRTEHHLWAEVANAGWKDVLDLGSYFSSIAEAMFDRQGTQVFFAEIDGRAVATGVLLLSDGVALLAGACTIPECRGRGAQNALLDHRLHRAAELGCDLAMITTLPGSASQRNSERNGFRVAYTRTKWMLASTASGD